MATILAHHIAVDIATASALEAKIKNIVADIKKAAGLGSYSITVDVKAALMKSILHHFAVKGFVAIEDAGKLVLTWDDPLVVPDKDNTARHFRNVTREALAKNFDESVELVNEQIEKSAQNGYFSCDVYSLSIFTANIQALIDALRREGYTASHSGSYLHVGWEE